MATPEEIKIRIIARDETQKAMASAKSGMDQLRNVANRLKIAIGAVSIAGVALGKSVVESASQVENLRVRLKFMTGSMEDANKAFDIMRSYASRVPFALEEIQGASASLLTVAKDTEELNNLLEITGDIAAVSGLSFQETAMQLQRAMSAGIASAELFRERGITAMLGFQSGVSVSADETRKTLISLWDDGTTTMKGATNDLARTFTGQVSMMQDAWFEMKLAIAETGVFDEVGMAVKEITEELKDPSNQKAIKDFTAGLIDVFKFAVQNKNALIAVAAAWFAPGGPVVKAVVGLATLLGLAMKANQEAGKLAEDITTPGTFGDFKPVGGMPDVLMPASEEVKKNWQLGAEGIKKGVEAYKNSIKSLAEETADATKRAFRSMEDAIVNFAMTGKLNFRDFANSVVADIIRIQTRQAISSAIGSGNILAGIGDFFGGFFANGGRPPTGKVSVVGERGPELFVPDSAGTIIPNGAMAAAGGGAPVHVTFNIQSWDSRDTMAAIQQSAPQIVGIVQNAFNKRGRRGPMG